MKYYRLFCILLVVPLVLISQVMVLPVPYHSQGAPNNPPDPGYPYPPGNNWCTVACLHMLFDYYDHMDNNTSPLPAYQISVVCNTDDVQGITGGHLGTFEDDGRRAAHFSGLSITPDTTFGPGYTWRRIGYSAFEDTNGLSFMLPGGGGLIGWMEVLNEGYPIIFNGQFPFVLGPPEGALNYDTTNVTELGHSILLVGYNLNMGTLIFHDPYYGPFVSYQIPQLVPPAWMGHYIFASPWEVKINAPDTVTRDSSFYVGASVRYTAPTLEYVQPPGPTFGQKFAVIDDPIAVLQEDSCTFPLNITTPVDTLYLIDLTQSSYACYWDISSPAYNTRGTFRVKAVGELLPAMSTSYPMYIDTLGAIVHSGCTYVKDWDTTGIKEKSPSDNTRIYPNPFVYSSTISFIITERSHVKIDIYNETGRIVRSLFDEELGGGEYRVPWYGKSNSGVELPSGKYFYCIYINGEKSEKKAILLK